MRPSPGTVFGAAAAAFVSGCVARTDAIIGENGRLRAHVFLLEGEKEALESRLQLEREERRVCPRDQLGTSGWLERPGLECQGAGWLRIENDTLFYVRLLFDDRGVDIRGAGPHGFMAPKQAVWLCVVATGYHVVSGYVFVRRFNDLHEVGGERGAFAVRAMFEPLTADQGQYAFAINPQVFGVE